MIRLFTVTLSFLSFFVILFGIARPVWADLVSEAKKEGKLFWYTTMGVVDHTKYIALFRKKYPFIDVKVRRAGGSRLIPILQTEHRAGTHLFDITMGSRFAPSFVRSGIFAKYISPEAKHFAKGTVDPEGYWADAYANGIRPVWADLVSEAKKEGKLFWYTTMGVVDHTKYIALFRKKYPFIDVKVRRAGGSRLIPILQTEHRAGTHLFDITMGSRFAPSFVRSGIFAKYISPEAKHFAKGTVDPEGYWADAYANGIGVTYNTEMVPADKVPKTWEDLLGFGRDIFRNDLTTSCIPFYASPGGGEVLGSPLPFIGHGQLITT